ncbi:uncharacterized protein SPSK_01931 [Sporothrix schenckii 1099-18]|uniref:Uncharacterized protein n=1 Tax=Sporothrix schenckii 1099-18 TaxID=1397361 RepID=A0A0F2MC17_SPOSC|nr:uncharacterized protein SPSK_01931 [Sporothrix schenckii 1099-18]KJR87248.1 hypothetical protein SPSK_01931 [Sporothrix schenckii 1099-18]
MASIIDTALTCLQHTSSFLSIPREVRNGIYRRVLVLRHPLHLFQNNGSTVPGPLETFAPEKPARWLALLYVNRQVHAEASEVLYGLHHFRLVGTAQNQAQLLCTFVNSIGPGNAGAVSHLSINFPAIERVVGVEGQLGRLRLALTGDGQSSLAILREKCPNLTILETLVYTHGSQSLLYAGHDSHDDLDDQSIREALAHVDVQLKLISSLRKIIVRFYSGPLAPSVVAAMQGFGWDVYRGDRAKLDTQDAGRTL